MAAFLFLLAISLVATSFEEDLTIYEEIFEAVDPDLILDNDRILQSYLKCFYGEIECGPHASIMKESIPDVLSTVCGKCSEKQKSIFKYSLNKFIPTHPKDWEKMLSIYDPKGEYWPNVKAFIES